MSTGHARICRVHDPEFPRSTTGRTLLREAISNAAAHFRTLPNETRRRAILVITDNIGAPTLNQEIVAEQCWTAATLVCGLTVATEASRKVHKMVTSSRFFPSVSELEALFGMNQIADMTGGEMVRDNGPEGSLSAMIRRIRARYMLYYTLPSSAVRSERRTIKVELAEEALEKSPGLHVLARTGYVVPER